MRLFYDLIIFLLGISIGMGILTLWQKKNAKHQVPRRLSKEEIARKTEELRISQRMGDRINDVDDI